MAGPEEHDDEQLLAQFIEQLDAIDDDSALNGCAELLETGLPSEGPRIWTKTSLLAFVVKLGQLLARARLGLPIEEEGEVEVDESSDASFRYYEGRATHRRLAAPNQQFTGSVSMVSVSLPSKQDDDHEIRTPIGWVLARDHGIRTGNEFQSVFSVEAVNALYHATFDHPGMIADRVQLITGARVRPVPFSELSFRFTPVSLYLAYRGSTPIYYVAQSAFFDGRASKLYVARDMSWVIETLSGYRPTPFAHPLNRYRIMLTMNERGDEPLELLGEMFPGKAEQAYLTVTLDYRPLAKPSWNSPLSSQVIAFSRVCTIEHRLKQGHFRDLSTLELILHELAFRLGRLLPWQPS